MKLIQKILIILLILATLMVVGCTETDEGGVGDTTSIDEDIQTAPPEYDSSLVKTEGDVVEDTVTSTEPPQAEIVEPVVVQEEEKAVTSISTPPEVTSSDIYASDKNVKLLIETLLNNNGFLDVNTQVANGRENGGVKVLILSYRSTASTVNELAIEMGYILGAYLGTAENGWDIDELSVVVGDINGNSVAIWYCTEDWTNDYTSGKISIDELLIKVSNSIMTL